MAERFILMKHDPEGRNHAYLYEYAEIVATIGTGPHAVDVVRCVIDARNSHASETVNDERVAYIAQYQLDRLYSGLEARSPQVFTGVHRALTTAWEVYDVNTQTFPVKPKAVADTQAVDKLDK